MEEQALSQEHEQVTSGKNEREIPVTDLASALQFAAKAHLQCVEADRRIASEYAKMSSTISELNREGWEFCNSVRYDTFVFSGQYFGKFGKSSTMGSVVGMIME